MLIDNVKPARLPWFVWRAHIWCKSITFAALKAHVVKLADTSDLGSDAVRYGGSSPSMGTYNNYRHTYYRKHPEGSDTFRDFPAIILTNIPHGKRQYYGNSDKGELKFTEW